MTKEFNVDFDSWIVTAENEDEAYEKIEERFCGGELPTVSSVNEI